MAEVKTPIEPLPEGLPYTPGPDEYVITADHSISDVVRWLVDQAGGVEDIEYILEEIKERQAAGHA